MRQKTNYSMICLKQMASVFLLLFSTFHVLLTPRLIPPNDPKSLYISVVPKLHNKMKGQEFWKILSESKPKQKRISSKER